MFFTILLHFSKIMPDLLQKFSLNKWTVAVYPAAPVEFFHPPHSDASVFIHTVITATKDNQSRTFSRWSAFIISISQELRFLSAPSLFGHSCLNCDSFSFLCSKNKKAEQMSLHLHLLFVNNALTTTAVFPYSLTISFTFISWLDAKTTQSDINHEFEHFPFMLRFMLPSFPRRPFGSQPVTVWSRWPPTAPPTCLCRALEAHG